MDKIRVLIADDHSLVRAGIRSLLEGYDDIEVVGEAGSGWEAIEQATRLEPNVVLMDIAMGDLSGLEATQEIKIKIEGIQESTTLTVEEIKQISSIINDVNDIVATIATAVEEQAVTTEEIAGNVAQASQGIGEVNENVAQSSSVSAEIAKDISDVSQAGKEVSSGSEQINLSAEQLSTLAEQLNEMVSRFKV